MSASSIVKEKIAGHAQSSLTNMSALDEQCSLACHLSDISIQKRASHCTLAAAAAAAG
jgi:hypothetical protein